MFDAVEREIEGVHDRWARILARDEPVHELEAAQLAHLVQRYYANLVAHGISPRSSVTVVQSDEYKHPFDSTGSTPCHVSLQALRFLWPWHRSSRHKPTTNIQHTRVTPPSPPKKRTASRVIRKRSRGPSKSA